MITVPNAFTPTHKHRRSGDSYEVIGNPSIKLADDWHPGILYRTANGDIFVRLASNFAARFEKIPDDPARTTFSKVACPECGGSGWGPDIMNGPEVDQDKCIACNGKGQVLKSSISKAP